MQEFHNCWVVLVFKVYDETRKFLKFLTLRLLFWNVVSKKKKWIKLCLSVYCKLHTKIAENTLRFFYHKRKSFFVPFGLGILMGLIQPPIYAFFVLPVCVVGLVRLLDFCQTNKDSIRVSFLFNVGYCVVAFYWPAHGAYVFGYSMPAVSVFTLIIILLSVLIPTVVCVVFAKIGTNLPAFGRVVLLACLWVLGEYFRSFVVFHFPFGLIGYGLGMHEGLFQGASVVGVLGLGFILMVWAGSFYSVLFVDNKIAFIRQFRVFLVVNVLFFGMLLLGFARVMNVEESGEVSVALVQGNGSVNKTDKENFFKYLKITNLLQDETQKKVDFIVWAEGVNVPEGFLKSDYAKNLFGKEQVFVFNGIEKEGERVFNSMFFWQNGEIVGGHRKHYLVPYGEYIPIIQKYKFGKAIARGAGVGFDAGKSILPIKTDYGNILPLICYEVAYSGKLTLGESVFGKRLKPNYAINITNDEWFGGTAGVFQHFVLARFRAVEEGLPLVRVANGGFSAIIDGYGRVVSKKTELFKEDVVLGVIPQKVHGGTFFAVFGNKLLYWFCMFYIQICVVLYIYEKNQKKFHDGVTNFLAKRAKKKEDSNYKKRW